MIISRISLKNWRNFRDVDTPLGNRAFLVGPNASGKSNFLDAVKFLRDLARSGGGLQKAVLDRGGLSKIRCLAARAHPDVEVCVELSEPTSAEGSPAEWRYAVGIRQQTRGYRQPLLKFEKVWRQGELILDRPDESDKADELLLTQTHLEQINANRGFRPVAGFLQSVLYLHLVPQLVRNPEAFVPGQAALSDPFGRNFLERVMATPEKTRKARLRRIEEALRLAVPQFRGLSAVKDDAGTPHLETNYKHWRADGAKQREDQFSDGTLRLIGLLWSLQEGEAPLLLEEPELSLNPAIVRQLPGVIHQLQKVRGGRQVILSTHSSELLNTRSIGGHEVLMLIPTMEGTDVQLASSVADVQRLLEGGMAIGDAVLPRTEPSEASQLSLSLSA